MKYPNLIHRVAGWLVAVVLVLLANGARGFSLLGPPAPWMLSSNNVIEPGEIGGPMDIGSGYRWNVPVVTYGFDQSFLDYFGSNGVAAVEGAIKIINDLPPASQIHLADYPNRARFFDNQALDLSLIDLKSQVLNLLLEQLGLANSTRYTFVLKQWSDAFDPHTYNLNEPYTSQFDWPDWVYPDYMDPLNFDPVTLGASYYVNGNLYTGLIHILVNSNIMEIYPVDPLSDSFTAVTSGGLSFGDFYNGLTYDDVGGLTYLFCTNTINYEKVLPGISGAGTNANAWVNGAWRPGIDKITFVRQTPNPITGVFLAMTNHYTDTYMTNRVMVHQQLQRIISQPDFLFSVKDVFDGTYNSSGEQYARTGTANWIDNSVLNGNPFGEGPGIITPPIKLSFAPLQRQIATFGSKYSDELVQIDDTIGLGSFDGTTNNPVIYPATNRVVNQAVTRMWLTITNASSYIQQCFTWSPTTNYGAVFQFQTSTNFLNWVPLFPVTNDGTITTYYVTQPASARRFYRIIPK